MARKNQTSSDVPVDLFDFDKDGNLVIKKENLSPAVLEKLKKAREDAKKNIANEELAVFRVTAVT